MPLAKNLEALLAAMDPAVAQAQRDFWEKNPAIAEAIDKGTVPQAEFSRQLNAKDQEIRKARESEAAMRQWDKENRPKHEKLLKELEEATAKTAELERKVAQQVVRSAEDSGVELNEQALTAAVNKALEGRNLSDAKINEIVAAEATKLVTQVQATVGDARKEFLEKTFPAATRFQADLMEVMLDHRQETGKNLDREAFSKFMEENNIVDPKKAYEQMMAPAREEKRINAEVEKRLQDKLAHQNLPGVTPGQTTPTDLGPLQLKISGEGVKYPEGAELGDRSAAAMAAKELRSEGTF